MSTTAPICGKPLLAITRRSSASAEPRYRAGSLPSALYAVRVARICGDSSTARGSGDCKIACSQLFSSTINAGGVAGASTTAETQPSATRGHFPFRFASTSTICLDFTLKSCTLFPYEKHYSQRRREPDRARTPDRQIAAQDPQYSLSRMAGTFYLTSGGRAGSRRPDEQAQTHQGWPSF